MADTKLVQSWSHYQETTYFNRLRLDVSKHLAVIKTTRKSRVELNSSNNTLPHVKQSGSTIPGQAYDYRTL